MAANTFKQLKENNLSKILLDFLWIIAPLILFFQIKKKKLEIKNYQINETYCKISEWMLNVVGVNMIFSSCYNLVSLILRMIIIKMCDTATDCTVMLKVSNSYQNLSYFVGMFTQIVSLLQIYEWASMKLIIIW